MNKPPVLTFQQLQLTDTDLHYAFCGSGPPLIIVPATLSHIEDWQPLIQFMGQWFTAYFFELPGHGKSTSFPNGFSSQKVANMIEEFVNVLRIEHFTLMGFSFGGILALRTLQQLDYKIDKILLIAPCVSSAALNFSKYRLAVLRIVVRIMRFDLCLRLLNAVAHNSVTVGVIGFLTQRLGNVVIDETFASKIQNTSIHTFMAVISQINEIVHQDFDSEGWTSDTKNVIPCHFAMSVNDPLLRYDTTERWIKEHFETCTITTFDFPYHQPPVPLTFEEYNEQFGIFIESI